MRISDWSSDVCSSDLDSLYYADIKRLPTSEGFVQHHVVRGVFKDGTPVPELHACIVARVTNGTISRLNELMAPAQFQEVWARLPHRELAIAVLPASVDPLLHMIGPHPPPAGGPLYC